MPERTTRQSFRLALRERPRSPLQQHLDYDLTVNETVVGRVYYNMTGYVGTLPEPDGIGFTLGERGISAYRSEIARINRDARKSNTSN